MAKQTNSTVSERDMDSEDKSVLRWGGLAGMLGGIVFILVPVTLFGFVPPAPADPAGLVMRFPDVRAAITLGNGLDFAAKHPVACSLPCPISGSPGEQPRARALR